MTVLTGAARDQFDLLNDPQAFASAMWGDIFMGEFTRLFIGDFPPTLYEIRRESLRLVEQASRTPGCDPTRHAGIVSDASNDIATISQHIGVAMGVVLEQLRQSLLACYSSISDRIAENESRDQPDLALLVARRKVAS